MTTVNPFATCFTRPGAMPFFFPPGESAGQCLDRLAAAGWRGQIIGPHGSGKSTLLAALLPQIEAVGRLPLVFRVRGGQRRLAEREKLARVGRDTLVVVDGYEQLSRWERLRLKRTCRRCEAGLLVTAHAPVGLATVYETRTNVDTLRRVVEHLTAGAGSPVGEEDVQTCARQHGANLREALFALYDLHEQRRRA